MPTSAIIIIGNEILSGKVVDENAPWLTRRLREMGVDLIRISTIPDDIDIIGQTVRELSDLADWVFTSGGVGPTHDDLTMAGVAQGFGVGLQLEESVAKILRDKLGNDREAAIRQMATIPKGAELHWDGEIFFPLVSKENVYILPGVPGLFRRKFESVADRFSGAKVHCRTLVTEEHETAIAGRLTDLQGRWPDVEIGSYPKFDRKPWTVSVTFEGRNAKEVDACAKEAESLIAMVNTLAQEV